MCAKLYLDDKSFQFHGGKIICKSSISGPVISLDEESPFNSLSEIYDPTKDYKK